MNTDDGPTRFRHPFWNGAAGPIGAALLTAVLGTSGIVAYVWSGHGSKEPSVNVTPPGTPPSPVSTPVTTTPGSTSDTSEPAPSSTPTAGGAGKVLAEYSVELPGAYGFNIGTTKPKQGDIQAGNGPNLDLIYNVGYASRATMVLLEEGSTPTYELCTTATTFANQTPVVKPGTNVCIVKADSTVVGVRTTDVVTKPGRPTVAVVQITVWSTV